MNDSTLMQRLEADRQGYDPVTDVYIHHHDWEGDQGLGMSIVDAVAAVTDTAPLGIDPLYESIDPESLDQYLRSTRRPGDDAVGGVVEFSLEGRTVTVSSNGKIAVECDPERDPEIE